VYEHGGLIEERIYLDGYEVYRKSKRGATTPDFERHTLDLKDDRSRVVLIEATTVDTTTPALVETTRWRFQVEDHLSSSNVELDNTGALIGYEEYYAFGHTSFRAGNAAAEVSAKRYRYIGKERDEESGLYYHGARYYAAWLGRWASVDPAAPVLGENNWYEYSRNNPLCYADRDGREPESYFTLPDPRGSQWFGYVLGAAAHIAIAYHYHLRHQSDEAYFNVHTLRQILDQSHAGDSAKLLPDERRLRPDITNVTTRDVFEIKPGLGRTDALQSRKQGEQQVQGYLAALNRAAPPEAQFRAGSSQSGELGIRFASGVAAWRLRWETTAPGVIQYKWERLNPRKETPEGYKEAYDKNLWVEVPEAELRQHAQALFSAVDRLVSERLFVMRMQKWFGAAIDIVGITASAVLSAALASQINAGPTARPQAPAQPGGGQVIPFPARPQPVPQQPVPPMPVPAQPAPPQQLPPAVGW